MSVENEMSFLHMEINANNNDRKSIKKPKKENYVNSDLYGFKERLDHHRPPSVVVTHTPYRFSQGGGSHWMTSPP